MNELNEINMILGKVLAQKFLKHEVQPFLRIIYCPGFDHALMPGCSGRHFSTEIFNNGNWDKYLFRDGTNASLLFDFWEKEKNKLAASCLKNHVERLSSEQVIEERPLSTHYLMHKLWTKAVGTEDYDKAEWKELEKRIEIPRVRVE